MTRIMFVQMEGVTWVWEWRWVETAVLLLALLIYLRGSTRQSGRSKIQHTIFFFGYLLLLIVVASPFNHLATQLFSMRVLQRILLVALIPLLILSSDPVLVLFAGLPRNTQHRLREMPFTHPNWFDTIRRLTAPAAIWLLFICVFWIGYDLNFHQLTIRSQAWHGLETGLLFIVASFYWWHILAVSPKVHQPMPSVVRIGYVLAAALPVKIIGLVLLFSTSTIYNYPGSIQLGYLSINDQSLGAMFHWSLGGIAFTWTGIFLMREWFDQEARKPIMPHAAWATPQRMLAPGFGNEASSKQNNSLPKEMRSNTVPVTQDKEIGECQSTRKLSRFTAVRAKILLIIRSRAANSPEN